MEHFTADDGERLHLKISGEGPPLILLHGGLGERGGRGAEAGGEHREGTESGVAMGTKTSHWGDPTTAL